METIPSTYEDEKDVIPSEEEVVASKEASTSEDVSTSEEEAVTTEEELRTMLDRVRFFITHVTEDGPGRRTSTKLTLDADKPFFNSVSTPTVMASCLVDREKAAAQQTSFVTQHNFMRPFCVRVTSPQTVTISTMPSCSSHEGDLLRLMRAIMTEKRRAEGESSETSTITFSAEVDGRVKLMTGACDLTSWNPPPPEKYTKVVETIPHVVNMWECNGDAIPFDMDDGLRNSMQGHSIVIEQRSTDEHHLFVVQGFHIHQLIMPTGDTVRFVWGGNESSFNIFQPIVATTSAVVNVAEDEILSWDAWCKHFNRIEAALQEHPNRACMRMARAMLNPCAI